MAATVDGAIGDLAAQLAAGHTVGYLAALAFYARFHRYSFRNTLLIRAQRPDASLVAGVSTWNKSGYRVRKGERGIWIWRPLTRNAADPETGEEAERVVGFAPTVVFDAAQLADLDGRPLPALAPPLPDDAAELYAAVVARIEAAGIRVDEGLLPAGVQGVSRGGSIVLRAGHPPAPSPPSSPRGA